MPATLMPDWGARLRLTERPRWVKLDEAHSEHNESGSALLGDIDADFDEGRDGPSADELNSRRGPSRGNELARIVHLFLKNSCQSAAASRRSVVSVTMEGTLSGSEATS